MARATKLAKRLIQTTLSETKVLSILMQTTLVEFELDEDYPCRQLEHWELLQHKSIGSFRLWRKLLAYVLLFQY